MPETREVSVPVTAAHIERGQDLSDRGYFRSQTCAVALALTDALGYPCSCGIVSITVDGPVRIIRNSSDSYQLPDAAASFILEADKQVNRLRNGLEPGGTPLEPFTFTVLVADEA